MKARCLTDAGWKNRPLGLAVLALVLTSTDCQNNDPGLAPDALSAELARAFCERRVRCCSAPELAEASEGRYATVDACIEFALLATDNQLSGLTHEVTAGRITIDVAAARTCIASYAGGACNTSILQPETITALPEVAQIIARCDGLLVGHVPTGSRCEQPDQCETGSHCFGLTPSITGAAGIGGAPLPPAGGGATTGTTTSGSGICVTHRFLGETCNDDSECDSAGDLFCRRPEFVCSPPAKNGEPCMPEGFGQNVIPCAVGSVCDPVLRRCARLPRAGEPCAAGNFIFPCDPDPALGLFCNRFSGLCAAPSGPGTACGGPALAPCRPDLACIPTQSDGIGACGPPPSVGEACVDRCVGPAVCNLETARCQIPGNTPIGGSCSSNEQCATLYCPSLGSSSSSVCMPSGRPLICDGSGVTSWGGSVTGVAGSGGFTGMGGTIGTGGKAGPGTAGAAGAGTVGAGGVTGTAGAGGVGGTVPDPLPAGTGGMTGTGGVTGGGGST